MQKLAASNTFAATLRLLESQKHVDHEALPPNACARGQRPKVEAAKRTHTAIHRLMTEEGLTLTEAAKRVCTGDYRTAVGKHRRAMVKYGIADA